MRPGNSLFGPLSSPPSLHPSSSRVQTICGAAGQCESAASFELGAHLPSLLLTQTICYVEQLGTHWPVEASIGGELVSIEVEEGGPVEYKQVGGRSILDSFFDSF